MAKRAGIVWLYSIIRIETGQTYVGLTVEPRKRWNTHRWLANSGRSSQFLHRAMAKYGLDAFRFEIVACCRSWSEGSIAEQQLIEQTGSHVSDGGYNLTLGGEGPHGRVCSDETKRRISEAKTGRRGRPITDAEKVAASERLRKRWAENPDEFSGLASIGGKAQSGRKNSTETRRRMSDAAFKRWASHREAINPLRVAQHH